MFELTSVALAVTAIGLLSIIAQRRSWRRKALELYRTHAAIWQSEPRWIAVSSRNCASALVDAEVERLGFAAIGCIQDATDRDSAAPRDERVMRIFLGDGGTIWAASYEMSGHDVLEFETEFSNGFVVGTGNNELTGRLTWPAGFDVTQEPYASTMEFLLEKHRQRIRARLANASQLAYPSLHFSRRRGRVSEPATEGKARFSALDWLSQRRRVP